MSSIQFNSNAFYFSKVDAHSVILQIRELINPLDPQSVENCNRQHPSRQMRTRKRTHDNQNVLARGENYSANICLLY